MILGQLAFPDAHPDVLHLVDVMQVMIATSLVGIASMMTLVNAMTAAQNPALRIHAFEVHIGGIRGVPHAVLANTQTHRMRIHALGVNKESTSNIQEKLLV